jgi:hypothetical protein
VALLEVAFGSQQVHFKVMEPSQFPEGMEVTMAEGEVEECLLYIIKKARYILTFKSQVGMVRHRDLLE